MTRRKCSTIPTRYKIKLSITNLPQFYDSFDPAMNFGNPLTRWGTLLPRGTAYKVFMSGTFTAEVSTKETIKESIRVFMATARRKCYCRGGGCPQGQWVGVLRSKACVKELSNIVYKSDEKTILL